MSADDASSDEWFARYVLDAVLLVVLVLTAIGVALYLDGGQYLRDWGKEPGAGFLVCMLLCPMLGGVTLGLVVYAGIRLFLRPRTLGHALVRLAFLVAHVSVFLVCADTISSTATAVLGNSRQSSSALDPTVAWSDIAGRDLSSSPGDAREGTPDASSFSPPSVWACRGCRFPVAGRVHDESGRAHRYGFIGKHHRGTGRCQVHLPEEIRVHPCVVGGPEDGGQRTEDGGPAQESDKRQVPGDKEDARQLSACGSQL
jgi:hypothetical protein